MPTKSTKRVTETVVSFTPDEVRKLLCEVSGLPFNDDSKLVIETRGNNSESMENFTKPLTIRYYNEDVT